MIDIISIYKQIIDGMQYLIEAIWQYGKSEVLNAIETTLL